LDNQYHAACVTYIDILGFRTIVDDVYRGNPVAVKKILDLFISEQGIIDPDCLKSHNTVFTAIINSGAIAVASDNHHYIDYFTPECLRSDRAVGSNQRRVTKSRLDFGDIDLVIDKIADCEQLQRMKRALEQRLNTHAGDGERILSKYFWATERHNMAVEKATGVFNLSRQEVDDLLVDI